MDEMLNDLAATDMAPGGWLNKFRHLKEEYLHHKASDAASGPRSSRPRLRQGRRRGERLMVAGLDLNKTGEPT